MPNWTESQLDAIKDRDKNLLVSAAAGSGKTAVLVERIINMVVEDGIDIDRLLIVTFTNAAAGEMRERILSALGAKLELQNLDKDKSENIRRQIGLLNKASIMTIHSFCISVIRSNFHFLDIDPNFRIGDTTEIKVIIQESIEEILEEEYEREDENFIKLVESFTDHRGDFKIEELLLKVYNFIQSQPYPIDWLENKALKFDVSMEEFLDSDWIRTVVEHIGQELEQAKKSIDLAYQISSKDEQVRDKYGDAISKDIEDINEYRLMLESKDIDRLFKSISSHKSMSLKKVNSDADQDIKNRVKDLRDEYKQIIDGLKKGFIRKDIGTYLEELRSLYPMINHLKNMVSDFSDLYRVKKLDKSIVDFNDLEHYTLELLEYQEVRDELREKYEYIFVDEYQDSNIVQETIINSIARENNRFLVGDVKQSIYRFRLADPTIFIQKYFSYNRVEAENSKRVDLSKNFRSRKEIIDGTNFIFKQLMSKDLGEIDYTEDAYLYSGTDYKDIYDNRIELNIIDKRTDHLIGVDDLEDMKSAEIEAHFIGDKIKSLIGKQTYDAKRGTYFDIRYRDIVILLRTMKNWGNLYEDVFIEKGIPVYTDSSSGYFDALEIKIVLNLLSIIDNTRQDIPLLSTMRSMIGGFTLEELISIRVSDKSGTYYDAICRYMDEEDDELSIKLKNFMDKVEDWKRYSRYYKLDEFIWKLLVETNYYNYVGTMINGEQRQANLTMLVDRANEFEKGSINGLFNFIRFSDKLKDISEDMGTAKTIGESENVVRIMSIHKSKGLEFPVVICGGLGKEFNMSDSRDEFVFHKDLGIATRYVDLEKRKYNSSFPELAIKNRLRIESLSEEMRILYVAFTRAKDKLILFGSTKDIEKKLEKWSKEITIYNLKKSKSFLDWIGTCLLNHSEVNKDIRDKFMIEQDEKNPMVDKSSWDVRFHSKADVIIDEHDKKVKLQEKKNKLLKYKSKNDSIREEIDRSFGWEYPYRDESETPSKVSVTELKKIGKRKDASDYIRLPELTDIPEFLRETRGYSSAERGTINHKALEIMSFDREWDMDSLKGAISEKVEIGYISQDESEEIDIEGLISFFESDIYSRILKSNMVKKEQSFVYKKQGNQDFYIQGIIDCYFEEDNSLVVLDYKTDLLEDENSFRNRYSDQLEIYAEALNRITGRTIKSKHIYSTHLKKSIEL